MIFPPVPIQINSIPTPLMAWKSSGSTPPFSDGFLLENSSGLFQLEPATGLFQLEA